MIDKNQTYTTQIDGWTFRIKETSPSINGARILLLLHGHLGNEDAMWVLTKPLPDGYSLLAPRAPVQIGKNQYSWHEIGPQWPGIDDYQKLTDQLLRRVDSWVKNHTSETLKYDVMGFSQGAVMAYALAILQSDRIRKTAAIAGFLPQNWKQELAQNQLKNKTFFIAHGTDDRIIPVQEARQAAQWLDDKGAEVTFCTAKTGHKISANCFNGLGEFFRSEADLSGR